MERQDQKQKMVTESFAQLKDFDAPFKERAFGAIFGAFLSDSIGSHLEFEAQPCKEAQVATCMTMPGGGPHEVAPGQITDDSELAMCLLWGLVDGNKDKAAGDARAVNLDSIAERYRQWIESEPFDIGKATEAALGPLNTAITEIDEKGALAKRPVTTKDARLIATKLNKHSKSNGSLMRCTPLAVFLATLVEEQGASAEQQHQNYLKMKRAVAADVQFTHSNTLVTDCIFLYQVAIGYLLNNPEETDRATKAFDLVYKLSKSELGDATADEGAASAVIWLDEAKRLATEAEDAKRQFYLYDSKNPTKGSNYDAVKWEGFLKHAFILSFYYLLRAEKCSDLSNYLFDCTREIVSMGGDTDTNACIAGGLIGAYVGFAKVNQDQLKIMFGFDCVTEGQKRPEYLSVGRHAVGLIHKLIELRPTGGDFQITPEDAFLKFDKEGKLLYDDE